MNNEQRFLVLLKKYQLLCFKNRIIILLTFMSLFFLTAFNLKNLVVDTTNESFLKQDSKEILEYREFVDRFEKDEVIMLVVVSDEIFTSGTLNAISHLHERLETELKYVDEVKSLRNARHVVGREDELVVSELFDVGLGGIDEKLIRSIAMNNPLYKQQYISDDRTLSMIFVRLSPYYYTKAGGQRSVSSQEVGEDLAKIETIIADFDDELGAVYLSGTPVITAQLKETIKREMRRFTLLTLLFVTLLLYVVFRNVTLVVLPLIVVIPTIVLTFSMLALFKQPIQTPLSILPSFLLAVGVCDSIHFLSAFITHFRRNGNKQRSLLKAVEKTAMPMVLTSLTTAVGLFSFSVADIVPIANLGIFAGVGVLLALMLTLLFLPLAIIFMPLTLKTRGGVKTESRGKLYDRCVVRLIEWISRNPKGIVIVCGLMVGFSVHAISNLTFSHNPLHWFEETSDVRESTALIDRKLGGVMPVEVLIDTGVANGVKSPAFLDALDAFSKDVTDSGGEVGKVLSITDMLKESHQALHNNDAAFYRVPSTRSLISQELLLLELGNAKDLFRFVDDEYRIARVIVMAPWIEATLFNDVRDSIMMSFDTHFSSLRVSEGVSPVAITLTGIIPILMQTMNGVIQSTAASYGLAFILITMMMVLLFRSLRYGLLAMFPNVMPVICVLGGMYWLDIPLDMFTLLVGSIAIGLAVDDTIHFMHGFHHHFKKTGSVKESVTLTLMEAGRAMFITTTVLAVGFMVFTLSSMSNLQYFGLLTSACVILALIADFVLAPALMFVFYASPERDKVRTRALGATAVIRRYLSRYRFVVAFFAVVCGVLGLYRLLSGANTGGCSNNASCTETVPNIVSVGRGDIPPCERCHGKNGVGDFGANIPRLAALNAEYLKKQLWDFRRETLAVGVTMEPISRDYNKTPRAYKDLTVYSPGIRESAVMSTIAKKLTAEEINQIAHYYGGLTFSVTPVASDFQTLELGRELALRGKPEYMLPRCGACHGPSGEGYGETFPPLSGQPAGYIIQQINQWQRGTRDNDHLSMMKNVANLLTDADKENVAAYYSNMSFKR